MKRSSQDSRTKARSDQLTENDPRSQKKALKNDCGRARETTRPSILEEIKRRESSVSRERNQSIEKNLQTQLENVYKQKKEFKQLEAKHFKLSINHKGILTKLQESETRIQELESQVKYMERCLAEKTYALRTETTRGYHLDDTIATLKGFKERALAAEKQVRELTDENQRVKVQLDMSNQKATTFRNESEALKVELKKQLDLMRTKLKTIGNLKLDLDAKHKAIDALKEEIQKQHKVTQEIELEAKRNRQNEESSLKRVKYMDEENLSLRKEVRSLHKSLYDFEMKLSKQDLQYQNLQEKFENAHTERAILQKKTHKLDISTASLEKEVVETQTLLEKSQQENQLLKNQVEQMKIKLAETIQIAKERKRKFEKDLQRTQEDFMKLKMQREDAVTKNRRATEALYSNERKIGIQADLIREQDCKIIELTKEVLRHHENAQKFKVVRATYSKVQRLGLDEERGDIILLPDTDRKTEKLKMYRIENRRLSKTLEEKETEIKDLKLEEQKLQHEVKNLKSKLDYLPEDALHEVHVSQTKFKALRRRIKAQEAEISAYVARMKLQDATNEELKNKLKDISLSKKNRFPPIESKNIKLKSEDSDPKSMKKPQKIVYLPPLQISSFGRAKM
ncbi:centrosomal protein of 63 kDa-like [Xiphophorus maculatus]|uniref:centrosomal protein of 63 kDa-like n=1 Tax=Xiphophorus maculatus TaxID=8083 RepID=UPI000C6D0AD9|nr:centrosomal protein of 63 kDa-like [Xiphophorus maculatus]